MPRHGKHGGEDPGPSSADVQATANGTIARQARYEGSGRGFVGVDELLADKYLGP